MDGITWELMFGRSYDEDFDPVKKIKINLTTASKDRKAVGPQAPAVASLLKLLPNAAVKPNSAAEAYGRGAVTPHNAGAALDIFYHKNDESTRAFAHGLLTLFIKNRAAMMWSTIEYNQMEFSQAQVAANTEGDPHFDHVHIDWIDYARSNKEISKKFPSFLFINEAGNTVTKTMGKFDQRMAMYWNAGARAGNFDTFEIDFAELNRTFDSQKSTLAAMTLDNFKALYAPPAPPPPPAPPAQESHTTLDRSEFYYWLNNDGRVVNPAAPLGGGGNGHFFLAVGLSSHATGDLPHPWAPAIRTFDPLRLRQIERERNDSVDKHNDRGVR